MGNVIWGLSSYWDIYHIMTFDLGDLKSQWTIFKKKKENKGKRGKGKENPAKRSPKHSILRISIAVRQKK